MDCPRCDRALVRYALDGREAVVCESCGYIGVPVEHRGEEGDVESWDDAITRFEAVGAVEAGSVETTDDDPAAALAEQDREGAPEPTVVRIENGQDPAEVLADSDASTDGDSNTDDAVVCERCGKRFDSRAQLNGHMAVHADGDE